MKIRAALAALALAFSALTIAAPAHADAPATPPVVGDTTLPDGGQTRPIFEPDDPTTSPDEIPGDQGENRESWFCKWPPMRDAFPGCKVLPEHED